MTFRGATFDSRLVKPGMLFIAVKGEKSDGHDYIPKALANGAAGVIDGYEELDRVAREYRRSLKAKVIGVTGSAGKTTTKELLKAFLSRLGKTYATEGNFNNHLGLPVTILNCPPDADFLVVEMGTNHPGEIAHLCDVAEPDAGLVTNVGTAHIEYLKTQDGIAAEKGTLLARAKEFGVASTENVRLGKLRELCRGEFIAVDPRPAWLAGPIAKILPGEHNLSNAALAFAVAERFGLTRDDAVAALEGFALPGSRWRRVELNGVRFVDDTYNANPDAMKAAISAFAAEDAPGRKIAVLGDMFELGDRAEEYHREVFAAAAAAGFDLVIAVGETSSKCRADFAFADTAALRRELWNILRAGDRVLLKASHALGLGEVVKGMGK